MKITNYTKKNTYYQPEHDCIIGGTITVSEFELVNAMRFLEKQSIMAIFTVNTITRDALNSLFSKISSLKIVSDAKCPAGVCIGTTPTTMLVGFLNTPNDPDCTKTGHSVPKNYKMQNYKIIIR